MIGVLFVEQVINVQCILEFNNGVFGFKVVVVEIVVYNYFIFDVLGFENDFCCVDGCINIC